MIGYLWYDLWTDLSSMFLSWNMTFLFTFEYSEQSGLSRTWIKDSHFCFMWLIKKSYFVPSSSSSDTLRGRFIYISYIIGTFKRNILISHFSWNVFWKNKIQEPAFFFVKKKSLSFWIINTPCPFFLKISVTCDASSSEYDLWL